MEDSRDMLARLKVGSEEFCQRLLTQLILCADYPRWGSRTAPSPKGIGFLRQLDQLSFGSTFSGDPPTFVDEFDLPRRNDNESGGAPDYACLWPDRLWMIELKTEVGSHRRGRLSSYFELAAHQAEDERWRSRARRADTNCGSPDAESNVPVGMMGEVGRLSWRERRRHQTLVGAKRRAPLAGVRARHRAARWERTDTPREARWFAAGTTISPPCEQHLGSLEGFVIEGA